MIHPHTTKHFWVWDLITTTALLYTATLSPFEASFLPPKLGSMAYSDPWFAVNRALDVIFFLDMILNFFLAYENVDVQGGVLWVTDRRLIVRHYILSWFPLDAATIIIPCGFDLYLASGFDEDATGAGFAEDASALRVLRVIRLAKLVRLVRASRQFKRWKSLIVVRRQQYLDL